ncbi:MAG: 4'-phosphopantetheinyl transferase superfamily protein [Ferruginibacter sp.]|nr:4'-phosphopantetheinyl transferase superfamily protein [Cytophagales bacterium]
MPLVRWERVDAACHWALWEVRETAADLREILQPPALDLAYLRAIRHEHKQQEWLASRLAARQLVRDWGECYRGIFKDGYDKPLLRELDFRISLSHSGGYGAAILHRSAQVGIDIEYPKEKLRNVQHRFLSEDELADAGNSPEKLSIYWCAKEVLYKLHPRKQLSFRENLRIRPFDARESGRLRGRITADHRVQEYEIAYERHGSLTIAYGY